MPAKLTDRLIKPVKPHMVQVNRLTDRLIKPVNRLMDKLLDLSTIKEVLMPKVD